MNKKLKQIKRLIPIFVALLSFYGCAGLQKSVDSAATTSTANAIKQPQADQEFRAAWVASVANINWPSKPGLSTEEQQKEALVILDGLKSNNFNAVVFQVRPQADALYKSELEPWSYFLTGKQGQAPDPYYDPLDYWIKEAHDRGLELHVWLNPYRAHHTSAGKVEDASIIHKMPESVVKLEEGYWWFDPSMKTTQDHSVEVVMDIVKRYDIDGVHFDDYFYPYESYHGGKDFPDDISWAEYQKTGGGLARGDWRRNSVNQFIERLYQEIKAEKKHVKFGLSPFGIWRPGNPSSIAGLDQYDKLYADARLWLNKGWIDYFSPQLYWRIAQVPQSFPVLLDWWSKENHLNRHLWPGINDYIAGNTARGADEIENQIMITRAITSSSPGVIHWSVAPLLKNDSLSTRLVKNVYKKEALVPESPWLKSAQLQKPDITLTSEGNSIHLAWSSAPVNSSFKTIVYYRTGKVWNHQVLGKKYSFVELLNDSKEINRIEVAYIDRAGFESERAILDL